KVNPPLRPQDDVDDVRVALAEGDLDCVATDHAPHALQDKDCEWQAARPGMLGLQTALSIVVATMVRPGMLDWRGVARVLSERPAEIVGLADQGRPIAVGEAGSPGGVEAGSDRLVTGQERGSSATHTRHQAVGTQGV